MKVMSTRILLWTVAATMEAGLGAGGLFAQVRDSHAPEAKPTRPNIYFYWDAEEPVDPSTNRQFGEQRLPNPPFWEGWERIKNAERCGRVTSGSAPQGKNYFEWEVTDEDHHSRYTEVKGKANTGMEFPLSVALGKTYYLAYYFNFTRINDLDIWHEKGDSADKGVELTGSGVRWCVSRGHWGSLADNQEHRYTLWLGNPTYHLRPGGIYLPNQSGYSASKPIQLECERWYSCVMAIKMATDKTGSAEVWIDGAKVYEYKNIRTCANAEPTIGKITLGGTIAQPAYDAPAHQRKFDALLLTDNWKNILDVGYFKGRREE